MACTYIYKGHRFNSEIELDDFLLETKRFESTLGDLVFSRSNAQNNVSSILSTVAKKSVELKKKYKEWEKLHRITYNEDGEESFELPPYIGVNKFLSGLKTEAGKLLFPEFREDEYWERRTFDWKIGKYTDAELLEFGYNKDTPPKITDSGKHKDMRELMTRRWEVQAKTGTAIHNVLQLCFSKVNGNYAFNLSDGELTKYILDNIEKNNVLYLNSTVIQLAILYARKLNEDLVYKFGDGLAYYTEFAVSLDTNVIHDGSPTILFGIIDLLIVDKSGKAHILDYKTSIHNFSGFSDSKKLSYSYLLATYLRMLEKSELNMYEGRLLVAPIQISDFHKDRDLYIYSGILFPKSFVSIDTSFNSQKMWDNIDEFMPAPFKLHISADKVVETVTKMMSGWFPDYSDTRKVTRETVIKRLKKYNKLVPDENGVYTWNKYGTNEAPITATTETEFVDKIVKYEQSLPAKRLRFTAEVKLFLKEGIKNGINNADFPSPIVSSIGEETTWIRDILSKYCDGNWEVDDDQLMESFGIIKLKTIGDPKLIDFVRVSTSDLGANYREYLGDDSNIKDRKGLTGTFEPDVAQKSKSNSLMVEAVNGNIELMETLLIINLTSGLEGYTIGNILVVNPVYANGLKMSNEELLYCFNELNKFYPVDKNNIGLGDRGIKFATKYELLLNELSNIINSGENKEWKDEYTRLSGIKLSKPIMDLAIDGSVEDRIKAVLELIQEMKNDPIIKAKLEKTYTRLSDLLGKEVSLYNSALLALALLKGVNFRQQLNDHDKWLESVIIWRNGVSGSNIDNPGNLDSETLNLITNLVTEAYLNTRDDILRNRARIRLLVENLKREKNFGVITERTIGNLASLYSNMYEETPDGDFVFKNPNRLLGAEREFLEEALYIINKNRFAGKTDEELQNMKDSNDIKYYRVPLALGGIDSISSVLGMLEALRSKLSFLMPKKAFERALKKLEGIFNAEEDKASNSSLVLYLLANYFDEGEGDNRIDNIKVKAGGILNLEHNLETLLLKHIFAYSVKDNIDAVFPMVRAAIVHISALGALRNTEFSNDLEYMENYIKSKVQNKSIVNPKYKEWVNVANTIKKAASTLTLAFAPVLALYQPLLGLWTDVSLMIRKPDGKDSFTFNNFKNALKLVYSDLSHFSNKPTICSALNELYGINDMDMNTYVDRISTGRRGFWNLENLFFKFASRPDYYNRMTIFTAQMMGDGCLNAHSINDKGELVYNWELDERFSKYAAAVKAGNGNSSDPEIAKLRSRYYAVAKLFVAEHAKTVDGKEYFQLNMNNPMALPRAYTSKEAESMKSLGDDIYGYYSHEKKSLIMSTGLGSMWLLFKTYWSGKKNLYLLSGGVRLRGKWEHYSESIIDPETGKTKEVKYYYLVDDKGNILFDKPPLSENEMVSKNIPLVAPVWLWKGQWLEGIILTLSDMARKMINKKSIVQGWNSTWNNSDEKLRNVYRSNIKLFGYDMTMFMLGGLILSSLLTDWLRDLLNDNKKNKDLATGVKLAAAKIAVMSVKNSFLDFNFIESVGSPVGLWTPFAFEWGGRTLKNWWKVAIGDEDFWDGVVNTSGGLKLIKPVLDTIKPEMFRTEREGGTFGVKD